MRYSLFAIVVVVVLSACGGGGGGGSDTSSPGNINPGAASFPIVYDGLVTAAKVDSASAGAYFDYVLSASSTSLISSVDVARSMAPQIPHDHFNAMQFVRDIGRDVARRVSKKSRALAIDQTSPCFGGGSATVAGSADVDANTGELTSGDLTVQYKACVEIGGRLDGELTVNIASSSDPNAPQPVTDINVLHLVISGPNEQLSVMGGVTERYRSRCEYETRENLLVRDDIHSVVVKTVDLVNQETSCGTDPYPYAKSWTGRIYRSDLGYVDVSTPRDFHPGTTNDAVSVGDGKLALLGASDGTAVFDLPEITWPWTDSMPPFGTVSFDFDGDRNIDRVIRLPAKAIRAGALFDLKDDDQDGMLNAWERIYGLDPNDPADAARDADGDGLDNATEAKYASDPTLSTDVPLTLDLHPQTQALFWASLLPSGEEVVVRYGATNATYTLAYPPELMQIVISIEKSSDIEWVDTTGCSPDTADHNRITCALTEGEMRIRLPQAIDQTFSLSVHVESAMYDPNMTDNTTTLTGTTVQRYADTSLTIMAPGARPALVGAPQSLDLMVQENYSSLHNATHTTLQFALPPDVHLLSLVGRRSGDVADQTFNCIGAQELACVLGTLRAKSSGIYYRLNATFVSDVIGNQTVGLQVSSDGIDQNLSDNTATTTLPVGRSASEIQAQISSVASGAEIVLSEPLYVGNIDFLNKSITLRGAASQPILAGNVLTAPGSTVTNLTFSTNSTLVMNGGTRIEANRFEEASHVVTPLDANGDPVFVAGGIIRRNTFANPCDAVTVNVSSVTIENNLFVAPTAGGCNGGVSIVYQPAVSMSSIVRVQNNAFYRTGTAIDIYAAKGDPAAFDVKNNIFAYNPHDVTVRPSGAPSITVSNNVFFKSGVTRLGGPVISSGEIPADPMFVAPTKWDFHLKAQSPAIDAGKATNAPVDDIAGNPRSVDGNGDGSVVLDIGPFEYTP